MKTLNAESLLNVISSAAEELSDASLEIVADVHCDGDLEKARELTARLALFSEALLEVQEEYPDALRAAGEHAEEIVGLTATLTKEDAR